MKETILINGSVKETLSAKQKENYEQFGEKFYPSFAVDEMKEMFGNDFKKHILSCYYLAGDIQKDRIFFEEDGKIYYIYIKEKFKKIPNAIEEYTIHEKSSDSELYFELTQKEFKEILEEKKRMESQLSVLSKISENEKFRLRTLF